MKELLILKLFCKEKSNFTKYYSLIKGLNLDKELLLLFSLVEAYYDSYQEHTYIGSCELKSFFQLEYSTYKSPELIEKLIDDIFQFEVSDSLIRDYIESVLEKDAASKIINKLLKVVDESESGLLLSIEEDITKFKEATVTSTDTESVFVSDDLQELLAQDDNTNPINWRLKSLQESVGPLKEGLVHIFARTNVGKCHGAGTKILMADGSTKNVEDICIGDSVMGEDSVPKIVHQLGSGVDTLYKITYFNGESFTVNSEHILCLRHTITNTLLNISVKDYLGLSAKKKHEYKAWKVGVEFDKEAPTDIPPYILGAWLGDGTSSEVSITNADEAVINEWLCFGESYNLNMWTTNANTGKATTYRLTNKQGLANPVINLLRKYSLLKNKHIPPAYLHSKRSDRLQLLAGLVDTDGSVASPCSYEITQKRRRLAEDILYLCRSLGYSANLREKIIKGVSYWRIVFYGNFTELPVRIAYKKLTGIRKKQLNFAFNVEELGVGMYYGFTLNGNHLYLLSDFTVTHNTSFLVSEITNFCSQLADNEYILYFNNEEAGRQVKYRFYTAMLNTPLGKLKSSLETTQLAMETYFKRGGKKLKLYDKDVFSVEDIDRFCYEYKPRIIVVDVADKVHFKGMGQLEGAQRLKELYRRYREVSKRHNCTVITSAQASADAAGKKWLDLIHMDMSKTGKPAELDLSIGIGSCTDEGKENIRYIHINKNKWNGRHDKLTAIIDPYTGRYSDA